MNMRECRGDWAAAHGQSYTVQDRSPVVEITEDFAKAVLASPKLDRCIKSARNGDDIDTPAMRQRAQRCFQVVEYLREKLADGADFCVMPPVISPPSADGLKSGDTSPDAHPEDDEGEQYIEPASSGVNRIFAYPLGDQIVGMAACRFPHGDGPVEIDGLMNIPGVENAGDVLLERVMTEAGADPTLLLDPLEMAHDRYAELGFTHETTKFDQLFHEVMEPSAYANATSGGCDATCRYKTEFMALRPRQVPHLWQFDSDAGWLRVGKKRRYLAGVENSFAACRKP